MILLRHGQSEFNLHFTATRRDPGIPDPKLTPLGHDQAHAAADAMAHEDVREILASPYTRALQTAAPIAARLGLPVRVHPTVRERYAFSCDIGSPVSTLATTFPEHDFDHLDEVWWPQETETEAETMARAAAFRAESASAEWRHTLVICHWGFIMALTGLSVQNGQWLRFDPTAAPPTEIPWRHV